MSALYGAPVQFDIYLYRGDDRTITFNVTDTNGAYDFTNKTLKVQIKSKYSGTKVVEYTEGSGITITNNDVDLEFSSSDFDSLTEDEYVYDLEVTDDVTDKKITWLQGNIYISKQVTS